MHHRGHYGDVALASAAHTPVLNLNYGVKVQAIGLNLNSKSGSPTSVSGKYECFKGLGSKGYRNRCVDCYLASDVGACQMVTCFESTTDIVRSSRNKVRVMCSDSFSLLMPLNPAKPQHSKTIAIRYDTIRYDIVIFAIAFIRKEVRYSKVQLYSTAVRIVQLSVYKSFVTQKSSRWSTHCKPLRPSHLCVSEV